MRRMPLPVSCLLTLLVVSGSVIGAAPVATAAPATSPAASTPTTIRVGTEGTYPPFSYHEGDQLTGYDVDVMKAVAERAGWQPQFVETTWDAIFPALDSDRIDTIANQVTINPDRQAKYSRGVIVTRKGDTSIKTLADVKGKVAAQSATSNWTQVARDAGAKIQTVDQFSQSADLLAQGRVDVIINDNLAVLDYLATTKSTEIQIAGNAGDEVSQQALVFRQTDAERVQQANAALQSLRADGSLKKISESYFGADVSVANGGTATVTGREGRTSAQIIADTAGPMLRALLLATIPLTLISFALGLILAVAVALARLAPSRWLNLPARAFVSVIRGTPLLVQLFIVFYGLPQLGLKFDPYPAAVIAFTLNVAGYASEVVRSAILSVPKGQSEAAATIGMGYGLTLRRVVLPQAARVAVPPLSNTFISLVKDTSLASVVLVTDMFRVAQVVAGQTSRPLELYLLAALYYWIVCTGLSAVQSRLEKRLGRHVAS